ncbi:MAG: AbrB/MazE/SpoVT family DNA-binding domain-containing protein [Candidatus Desantisbacteria bacterium]
MRGLHGKLAKINAHDVITIPAVYRKTNGFKEGSLVEVVEEGASLKLIPMVSVPEEQSGFHSKEWVKAEKEASLAHQKGKTIKYNDVDEMLRDLDR